MRRSPAQLQQRTPRVLGAPRGPSPDVKRPINVGKVKLNLPPPRQERWFGAMSGRSGTLSRTSKAATPRGWISDAVRKSGAATPRKSESEPTPTPRDRKSENTVQGRTTYV